MLYRQFEMRVPARAHVIAQLQRRRFEQTLYCSDGEAGACHSAVAAKQIGQTLYCPGGVGAQAFGTRTMAVDAETLCWLPHGQVRDVKAV